MNEYTKKYSTTEYVYNLLNKKFFHDISKKGIEYLNRIENKYTKYIK